MPAVEVQWALGIVTVLFQCVVLLRSLWVPLDAVVPAVHAVLGACWAIHLTLALAIDIWWLELVIVASVLAVSLCVLRMTHWCCPCIFAWQGLLEVWTALALPWEALLAFRALLTHRAGLVASDLPGVPAEHRVEDLLICASGAVATWLWLHILAAYSRRHCTGYRPLSGSWTHAI